VGLYAGDTGKVRARGDVIDLRKTGFVPMEDHLATSGIIHQMTLDARVDGTTRELESLTTAQPFVAVEPSDRMREESCRDPAPRLQALVGKPFDAGFGRELSRHFGGALGCSHLLTLFHLMASTIPRALDLEEERCNAAGGQRPPGERFFQRCVIVDGSQPEETLLQLSVQLSDYHTAPAAEASGRLDHLCRHDEVRVLVEVDMSAVRIESIQLFERGRTLESLATAEWSDCSARVAPFEARPIMPGLGSALRAELASEPEAALWLDALLQLAPGFVQCMPATTDSLISRMSGQKRAGAEGGSLPDYLALGGAADSCYMWRRDGPLLQIRSEG